MADGAAIALAKAASTIHAAARSHKKASAFHRKQAGLLMAEYERVKRECAAAGITVVIEDTDPRPEESQSHG